MATKERVYRLTLADFDRYLNDKRGDLTACYQEIEEVHAQLQEMFKRELAAWQEQFGACYPQVLARRREMPPAFVQLIDRTEAQERARIVGEVADLDQKSADGRTKMDSLLRRAQAATEALRTANPEINAREEKLKAAVVKHQDEYTRAYEQMESLERRFWGWLTNAGRIGSLKKIQKQAKQRQTKTLEQLRQVRQEWQEDVTKAGETQSELRQQFEQVSVQVSEMRTRHDYLQGNLDTLAEQAAIQRVLEELGEPPQVPGDLGAALADLAQRNGVRHAYEEGLRAVSTALGLTKGVGDGLERFEQSVAKVWAEQRQYNLKEVQAQLPDWIATFFDTWKELRPKVKDEKYLGAHPLEFSKLVDEVVKTRLTDEAIKNAFETMGEALNRATKAWG